MFRMIGTWKMCMKGMPEAVRLMRQGASAGDGVVQVIRAVEDEPGFVSVGYGGLPALDGHVYTDSAYMDGDRLRYGCTMSAENIASPILAAKALCGRQTNCVLAGQGAEKFAREIGLEMKDMRTAASQERWRQALKERRETEPLTAYRGHDTVCVLGVRDGHMVSGVSTSGLFLKEPGRVGDSPVIGSGFYCDSRFGAAAATGLGEDIMRGCLSHEIVSLMRHGASAQQAAEEALNALNERMLELDGQEGSISVIAMDPEGNFGAATTLPVFPFVVGGEDGTRLMAVFNTASGPVVRAATEEELTQCD